MFNNVWNYARGYVIINISGFSVERFVNMAAYRGAPLSNVRYRDGVVTAVTTVAGFRELVPVARKTKCRLRIAKRGGLPFIVNRYRKRPAAFLAPAVFTIALYVMSSYVWFVEIEGCAGIDANDVAVFLERNGVRAGAFKRRFDERALERALQLRFDKISWVTVDVKGTRASVRLIETLPEPERVDRATPTDVLAGRGGEIISVVTSAGTPLVKAGDAVNAGDVLVSAELVIGNEDTGFTRRYVHASAKVTARVEYSSVSDVPLVYSEDVYTGDVKREWGFTAFGKGFTVLKPKVDFGAYEVRRTKKTLRLSERYPLPFSFASAEYRETVPLAKTRTVEQAEFAGYENALSEIAANMPADAATTGIFAEYERVDDFVRVTVRVTAEQRIDVERVWGDAELEPVFTGS